MKQARQRCMIQIMESVLILVIIALVFLTLNIVNQMQGNARVINYSGIVRGGTQKLVKQELVGVRDDDMLNYVDQIICELQSGEGEYGLIRLSAPKYQDKLEELSEIWADIKAEIDRARMTNTDGSSLYELSQNHYIVADAMVGEAEQYLETIVVFVRKVELFLVVMIVMIGVLLAMQMSAYVSLQRQNRSLNKMAFIDAHTGLPNKAKCEQMLSKYKGSLQEHRVCCMMFDLNNLKTVNDTLGHMEGDMLILNFARALRESIVPGMFIGRYGGDEFIVIAHNLSTEAINDFIVRLEQTVMWLKCNESVTDIEYAYGYAFSTDYPGESMQTLLRMADKHMYESKTRMKIPEPSPQQ